MLLGVCFLLGGGWIAFNGRGDGLSEAGGPASVLSAWLMWAMIMIPLVGLLGLTIGVLEWLVLRQEQLRVRVAALATGAVGAAAAAGMTIWFSGVNGVEPAGLLTMVVIFGLGVAILTMRDAKKLRTPLSEPERVRVDS
jgi:hypothetical protein